MAFLSFNNVRIAGIAAGVPKNVVSNLDLKSGDGSISGSYSPEDFVKLTGVRDRRVSEALCTSDLCYAAAERLIADLRWERSDIDAVIFVSQTADYALPATACILQDRLGLSRETYAADVALGCSGWVYGLSYAMSLATTGMMKKVLLLCGDAKRRAPQPLDPLFGCAGTATAVEFKAGAKESVFHFGTDGSGYDAIIIPDSGSRNQVKPGSFKTEMWDGRSMHRMQTHMKGMDVFSFGITTAPKTVKKLAERFSFNYLSYDYYIFHQANMKMNNMIVKKLKLPSEKVPSCMLHFGNTSSASIPLTIVTQLKGKADIKPTKYLCCGFGVGLSWGTVAFEDQIHISDLVEVDDPTEPSKWA